MTLFEVLAGGAFDHLNYQHTREFDQIFQKSQMPGVLRRGSMGCFGVGQYKMQTIYCYRPLFSPRNQKRDKNSPTDCFLTLKTMVCMIQSAVCILYSPVLEWTGTLVRKCVHKQSYINYRNDSLHQISTNSGKPTFDIFSFTTSGPTDKL